MTDKVCHSLSAILLKKYIYKTLQNLDKKKKHVKKVTSL